MVADVTKSSSPKRRNTGQHEPLVIWALDWIKFITTIATIATLQVLQVTTFNSIKRVSNWIRPFTLHLDSSICFNELVGFGSLIVGSSLSLVPQSFVWILRL